MKSVFSQTARLALANTAPFVCLRELPEWIRTHTDWDYTCVQTDTGFFLRPTFRHMPYRNSFVPEIDVVVSRNDTQTVLTLHGQPVKSVRVFMSIWFGCALLLELFLLALAITSHLDRLFPVLIPIVLGAFADLLCRLATGAAFRSVVKAIQTFCG